jgi:hypothetical protein
MTTYRKTMREALEEMHDSLNEDNMDLLSKAAGGAMQTLKMKDGKLKLDSFTASAIKKVYDKVNPANQKKMSDMINNGTKSSIMKLQDFVMKQIKSSYNEELDLDEGTWATPDTPKEKAALKKLLSKPLKAKDASDKLYDLVGDDQMADDLDDYADKHPNDDVRAMVKSHMKRLGIKEESDLDEGPQTDRFNKRRAGKSRQLKDPKKEVMVVKKGEVIVIDKKDQDNYMKKGWKLAEGNDLDEAKYELYHKDFSTAMQHAYHVAKKHHGITIDPKEIDDKVATGPSKPSEGKTNTYRLKGDKGAVQIQVYNKGGSKPFELNMYKEEVELDEASKEGTIKIIKTKDGKFQIQKMTKGKFVDIGKPYNSQKEAEKFRSGQPDLFGEGAAADARRAMARDKDFSRRDSADDDNVATDDDVKAASKNIIMQLRKAISLKSYNVEFADGKHKVDSKIALAVQSKYNSMRRPADKEKYQMQIAKSYKGMLQSLKAGYHGEQKESILSRIDKKLKERKNG